ncbi:transcription-repair coupling factor (superfamily II helicase) [Pseudomonas nitritireducens]|uniref:Transcription-repair-coupling factor n=1 Tax=Pseudomonas nitroreducens TaxID=46680 RepID=A0A7W7KEE9_PSENT|nr:DEAD/DEAH box helicase [Pseudomonas nitritireducens]MBB4861314.1 transcription-repair coupling factor (superfamily II helicase) [Pseudomonas nitritireducens]
MLAHRLSGPSFASACAKLLEEKSGLVIARNEHEASTLLQEIGFYAPALKSRLLLIRDSETLPFDLERAPSSIMSERAWMLNRLANNDVDMPIVIASAVNCMRLISGKDFWKSAKISLSLGDSLASKFGENLSSLLELGYAEAKAVKIPGQYATRGRVVDFFPVGISHGEDFHENTPVRMTLDELGHIQSIIKIDVLTQESVGKPLLSLDVFPNREYRLDREFVESFRSKSFTYHDNPRVFESYKVALSLRDHPEFMSWIGLNPSNVTTLVDMLEYDEVLADFGVAQAMEEQWRLVETRHIDIRDDLSRTCPPIDMSWRSPEATQRALDAANCCTYTTPVVPSGMKRVGTLDDALALLKSLIDEKTPILFVMKSAVRARHVKVIGSMLGLRVATDVSFEQFIAKPVGQAVLQGTLTNGYLDTVAGYRLITEYELFGTSIESSFDEDIGEFQRKAALQGLVDIKEGDFLVHATKGIGQFQGFETINFTGTEEDTVRIGFANDASIFVKVSELDMVSRYSGGDETKVKLSKLNHEAWAKGLQKAQEDALSGARQLILVRNARRRMAGLRMNEPDEDYDHFVETFEYEETPDQKRSISEIIRDLTSGQPMDRLICGDVGFGKTEVAHRAAFMVANQGYQVALLAPTALLAEQHYLSTRTRFEGTDIKVLQVTGNKVPKDVLKVIRNGEPCYVIGTNRLLQNDVLFGRLALIIIDEEQRFGVDQKEQLQDLRGDKHVLAMTATPIPRTLTLSMVGIRDISVIATPPARRLSVRTILRQPGNSVLREAIGRELSREGQVFYVHNSVKTMPDCAARLAELYPTARIGQLHGQMGKAMTETLVAFQKHEYDILVCTTVVEVGIDIPNANTLIVENADHFGLSQLHQLRGRVGRSSRQAYAYLLSESSPGTKEHQRMVAMEESSNLGQGILLARHDLEIRGIGEVLGREQSGHVHAIGFSLYMRLLQQAITVLDENPQADASELMVGNVNIPLRGRIPHTFMADKGDRLAWYQRLMGSDSVEELDHNMGSLKDQYGFIPTEVVEFYGYVSDHIVLKSLGLEAVQVHDEGTRVVGAVSASATRLEMILRQTFGNKVSETDRAKTFLVSRPLDEVIRGLVEALR